MKKILLGLFISLVLLFLNCTISNGASYITYLYLDAIKIENPNIEIISNDLLIDTTKSKIKNTVNIKNTSDKEIEINLEIPLKNKEYNISIKDLSIKLNDVEVEYVEGDKGQYFVKTRISANSGKKINIEYKTENDLQRARVIKCNFDNFKDKKVGKLKVDVKIDEKNIPLVEKIYPGHFTFDNNTISIEYYNYEVNTLTKDVIVKKETFNNLLYGREYDFEGKSEDEIEYRERDLEIIKTWYSKGNISLNDEYYSSNHIIKNIYDYKRIKTSKEVIQPSEPLLCRMIDSTSAPNDLSEYKLDLKGKNICIDYVETEGEKELYVSKSIGTKRNEYGELTYIEGLVKTPERTILQTKGATTSYHGQRGANIIYVGQGINGESLKATEKEKIDYINQINADMYIRIEIYDGNIEYKKDGNGYETRVGNGMVGFYDNNNSEIAKAFALGEWDKLLTEEIYNNGYYEDYKPFYSSYEEYEKNYYKDYYKDCVIQLKNEDITNKCEVPTVIQFIGNRVKKDGKYVVNYFDSGFYDNSSRGLSTTKAALQTSQAKKMLASNKQKNLNIKTKIENQISNLTIKDDEKKVQQDIKDEIEALKRQEELKKIKAEEERKTKEKEEQQKIINKNIMIFAAIGLGIILCIIVLIIEHKKNKV